MNPIALRIARATLDARGWAPPIGFVDPQLVGPDGRTTPALKALTLQFRMALFSPPGSGKTTLLRAFAHASATACVDGVEGARAPLLIRHVTLDTLRQLEAVLAELGVTVTHEELVELLHSGDLMLLIDGVDELPDARLGAYYIANVLHRFPEVGAVVAARPGEFGAELSELSIYALAAYSTDQIASLVRGMGLGDGAAAERFQRYIAKAGLADLARTPLLVKLLFEASDGGSAPPLSTADLYADLLDQALRSAVAGCDGEVAEDQLLEIMGEFATRLHVEGRLVAPVSDLMIDWSRQGWPFDASLIPDLLAATRLVRVDGDEIMFTHRSIHEFMVARRLQDDPERLLEVLDLGETSVSEILRFAAALSDEIAPLVDLLLTRERTLDAITCLRFARVPNPALAAYVAVKLGHHIGDEFIRRLLQQITPELDHLSSVEIMRAESPVHDRLLGLLDEACDPSRPNHERGARFELFAEALFDESFEPVERNWRTEHGELDLVMEIRGGTPYWDHWGADVLVECKNLATPAESIQAQAFAGKVAAARVKLAFMVSVNGFTADAMEAFRSQSRGADRALIVPIAGEQIRQMLQRQSPIEAFIKDRIRDIQYERKFPRA